MDKNQYGRAGVDIDAGDNVVNLIKPIVKKTYNSNVLGDIGGFGGLFQLTDYKEPVLVSSADGVGTKLRIALAMDMLSSLGGDLANHSINDVWVQGADPLFFLDYIASGNVNSKQIVSLVGGLADTLSEAGCVLIGGETAEMPGIYSGADFDIAGFIVGAVEKSDIIDGSNIKEGDILIGIPSSGLHTNGYSLVRHIFDLDNKPEQLFIKYDELQSTLGEALIAKHISYYSSLKPLQKLLKGMAHITGGGIVGNLPRILPSNLKAIVRTNSWETPPIFDLIRGYGSVSNGEMYRVFNMGIGLIAVVDEADVSVVLEHVSNSIVIGSIYKKEENELPINLI
jgi:phosphoribosylformylglycinamidine cyclo-ligase